MVKPTQSLLQRLHALPDDVPPHEYRFFVFSNYIFLVAGLLHFGFVFVLGFLGVYSIAVYNIFSSLIWLAAIVLNLKGASLAACILADVEILVHTALTAVVIGWDAGFHYYILAACVVVFVSYFSMSLKIAFAVCNALGYVLLNALSHQVTPLVPLDALIIQGLNYANILGISFSISFAAFYYRYNVLKMEGKLAAEHQRTVQALEDRNRALKQINADLADAADYVRTVLPPPLRQGPVRSDWRYIPSASLGGDAFGYHWLDRDHFGIYLLDVSGHGVGAALLSVTVMNVLRSHALPDSDFREPDQVLAALNQAFPAEDNNDMFFTIWYGVYNRQTHDMTFSSGGHPPALLVSDNQESIPGIELLGTKNHVIGGIGDARFKKETRRLHDNACLYVFSDGLYEFPRKNGDMWRLHHFANFLQNHHTRREHDIDRLIAAVEDQRRGDAFDDDVTIMRISFR